MTSIFIRAVSIGVVGGLLVLALWPLVVEVMR